ncbi:MAG: hypothetical protein HCTETUND2_145 [Candidatus Hodgkinia cicadicola]|nr:MAG: hypothetical protein HCTETUND2_145 [Candidatus Hodgkinia cicadicola]
MWVLILSAQTLFGQTSLFSVSAKVLSVLPPDSLIVAIAHGSLLANPNIVRFEAVLALLWFRASGLCCSKCE